MTPDPAAPELLAALLMARADGDDDTAAELADLLGDPEHAAALMEQVQGGDAPGAVGKSAAWDESKHPRDHGKFSSKPGAEGGEDLDGANEPWQNGNDLHPEHPINRQLPTKFETDEEFDAAGQFYEDMGIVVDGWMKDGSSHLEPAKAELYSDMLKSTFNSMPLHMAQAAAKGISRVKAYSDQQSLTRAAGELGSKAAREGKIVAGMFSSARGYPVGVLHIDGGDDAEDMKGIYSHELGHSVDVGYRFSGTDEWKAAFVAEIDTDSNPLSEYARTNTQEGFAEYVRLVVDQPGVARKEYPQCWAFLKTNGLV